MPPSSEDPVVTSFEDAGKDPTPPDVQEMFVYLTEQMTEIHASVRAGRTETAELRSEVMPHIKRLNRRVFGAGYSKPPPPKPGEVAPGELALPAVLSVPPLTAAVETQHDSLEMLQQEVSNLRGELGDLRGLNLQQSKAMGLAPQAAALAKKTRVYLTSRAGIRDLIGLVVAIAGLVGVWRGTQAAPVTAPAPTVQTAGPR